MHTILHNTRAGEKPTILSASDKNKNNRMPSLKQIKYKTNVTALVSTIKRLLQAQKISSRKMKGQPKLSIDHERRRLQFACGHYTWDNQWSSVLFSDKKNGT